MQIREIFQESGKVVAVFCGHVHQNSHTTIGGIQYITVQSLVERMESRDVDGRLIVEPSGSYAMVQIDEDGALSIEVLGKDRFSFSS